jgi:hypothetical protein
MTQHPIHNLPPEQLRGYARGLRDTAALLGATWSKSGMVPDDEMSLAVQLTREAWEREAEMVEGFAARLDDLTDEPRPVTRERVESWVAKFEPPIQSFATPDAIGAPDPAEKAQPSRGEGNNAGATAPLAAAPTQEENAQTGLADAVAENLAEQPAAIEATPEQVLAAAAEAKAAFVADHTELQSSAPRAQRSDSPWTEARLSLLDRLFPTIIHQDRLFHLLNALPGLPIPSANAVAIKARKLGLHRRGEPVPAEYADAPASRSRQPQMAAKAAPAAEPPKSTAPIVTTAFIPLTTEEMHNLRESFRKKEFGVSWLADEYGMPPDEAQKIVNQLREEQAQKKAKAA